MFAVADEAPQVKEPIQPATMPAAFGLEISGLSFKYPGSEVSVLNGINISIPPGKRIAIVGPSGSGKSTLVNLLTRSWEYSTGSIRIGGTELNTLASQSIYARISILAQTPVILTDTLRRNLLIGDLNAKDDDLVKSLDKVELGSWYKTLPQGIGYLAG